MFYDHSNVMPGTTLVDMDTNVALQKVMTVDTESCEVTCAYDPIRIKDGTDEIDTYQVKYQSICPVYRGKLLPCVFHCYGRQHSNQWRGHNACVPDLRLVPDSEPSPSEKVRQRLKAQKPPAILQCRCGCRELIEVKTGLLFKNGKPSGGTKQYLCAHCLMKGERVVVI